MAKIVTSQIIDNSDEVISAMREQAIIALKAIGQEAEGNAKDGCPVDTGRLRNSISNEVNEEEMAVYIGTNVEYAPEVEFIDMKHKTGGAHFLRNSVTNYVDNYKAIMEAALKS